MQDEQQLREQIASWVRYVGEFDHDEERTSARKSLDVAFKKAFERVAQGIIDKEDRIWVLMRKDDQNDLDTG